ncbi:MAG: ATP-dependent Clp protease proteolytic subunit [Lachnospiraceae bacterium]|jgi:ATP-dependent Clp protease protease subunit|nr:ATP-dependent Clp protease proteolytic subunit [Lachnospiraceae bacterium]
MKNEKYIYMPNVLENTHNGFVEVTLASKHFMNRKLFVYGSITPESANAFVAELMYLTDISDEPIDIYINSGGGEVNSGLLMYDVIQSVKSPINIYCTGRAMSMAAILLAGGQKGRRFILPHSEVMIHEPLITGGIGGSASSIRDISDSILNTKKITNEILAKHTGKTLKTIDKATLHDNYMTAEESVKFGICDQVVDSL